MASHFLRRFSDPDILRKIKQPTLIRFLLPYADYLSGRGLNLPTGEGEEVDYLKLIEVLLAPDDDTPTGLFEALYYVDEMATQEAMDSILDDVQCRNLSIETDDETTAADVAMQTWNADKELLKRKHAEQAFCKDKSYESFQTRISPAPEIASISPAQIANIEQAFDDGFAPKLRGRNAHIIVPQTEDGQRFLIRHGDPFRREERADGKKTASISFRPIRYDAAHYLSERSELRINARSKWERDLYLSTLGKAFFGRDDFFQSAPRYTLEPLRDLGEQALVCSDVDGLKSVVLREIHFRWGGKQNEIEVRKAKDVFAAYKARGRNFPSTPKMIRAIFQVTFIGSTKSRPLVIRPPVTIHYARTEDSVCIDEWLAKRGYIIEYRFSQNASARTLFEGN
jgi:hypothetical protein